MGGLSKDGSNYVTNEIINTSSHLAAAIMAFFGTVLLVVQAVADNNMWGTLGFTVYGLSLIVLFTFSTLHHGLTLGEKGNRVLRTFDYLSIFVLIAGTVTPIVLLAYRTTIGWAVLATLWAIAALGISLRASIRNLPGYITNTMFIVMGWLPVVLIAVGGVTWSAGAFGLLLAGGLLYSFGMVLYAAEWPWFHSEWFGFHEIWHIMVVLAALCHYLFMYLYLL